MLTLEQRAEAVLVEAWRRLPPLKRQTSIGEVIFADLGAKHGSWSPDTHTLTLSTRLFTGETPAQLMLIDSDGNAPPLSHTYVSRALHTTIHELSHAIGTATGLDETSEWLRLSGWVLSDDDPPGTDRYWEDRPGWPQGPSPWRHRTGGVWFVRDYSRKTPAEDFADAVTHVALGWSRFFEVSDSGRAKLCYVRREVWGERGAVAIAAARERWQARLLAGVGV